MTFRYQQTHRYVARIAQSLEELGEAELAELGARAISASHRVIYFEADTETLYRINYLSRLISRVLAPLAEFSCHSTDYLYRKARSIPWKEIFQENQTFSVSANVSNSKITHAQYAALRIKDGVADYFRQEVGRRPDVDRHNPDVRIHLHMGNNRATVSLDTSGGALHRRAYRIQGGIAPLQETVAAAILRMTEWDGSRPLYDPMCGSGTLIGEALMHFCRIPAGYLRNRFGFESLPDFDPGVWKAVKKRSDQRIRRLPDGRIAGSDLSAKAVATAKKNLAALPEGRKIPLRTMDFNLLPGLENSVIVCNPPYGIRLQKETGIEAFYRSFGDFLKRRSTGSTAFVYFGNREMIPHFGLKPSWKRPLSNGGLDGRLVKFELY